MKKSTGNKRQYKGSGKRYRRIRITHILGTRAFLACIGLVLLLVIGSLVVRRGDKADVYAAAQKAQTDAPQISVPPGISGILTGVRETKAASDGVARIGTSCEEVLVGQRRKQVESVRNMNASSAVEMKLVEMNQYADKESARAAIMSDNDYGTLLAIVEAEAGGEDLEGRIMVANVIMNRVKNETFPNSVYEVVWERVDGMAQFSPTDDGRIESVEVSELTVQAVHEALEGKDLSQGALFFVAKDQANQDYVDWFDKDLVRLFEHGVHTFYTYPDQQN